MQELSLQVLFTLISRAEYKFSLNQNQIKHMDLQQPTCLRASYLQVLVSKSQSLTYPSHIFQWLYKNLEPVLSQAHIVLFLWS